ncbi:MAG: secondary thiamine-phosphate synthase enzyme YjbQ [Actinomycetota bacterium]
MKSEVLSLDTSRARVLDITDQVQSFAAECSEGIVNVFAPHATAGVALMETGSGSEQDLVDALNRLLPRDDDYIHSHGSPGHGADHLLPVFVGPSVTIPVLDGRLQLGTWQSLVVVDLNRDNPRRNVRLSFVPA